MYENILLPVDDSEGTTGIIEHAGAIAGWYDASVTVLHVADSTRDSVTVVEGDVVDALARQGDDIVEEVGESLTDLGVECHTEVRQGDPAPMIVEYAEAYDHDLIIIPSHGRTGLSRYLLGSVTEKVIRLSSIPVLTARMQPDEQLRFPYEEILLPTDGSPAARNAATHGLGLAESVGATVRILAIADTETLGPDVRSVVSESDLDAAASDDVADIAEAAKAREIPKTVTHVERGDPAAEIVGFLERHQVDAIVMGTIGRRGVDRILLGSVAEKTVRSANVPVMTVAE